MKKIALAIACSASLILPSVAFADETVVTLQMQPTQDLSAVFATDDVNNLQVATLSSKEMQETEGAVVPFIATAIVSGALGAWVNHGISKIQTGEWASTSSTLFATGSGMIGGGYSNLMLRGAGISTNPFSKAAWQGSNGIMNGVIRLNGTGLGLSYSGIYQR